MLTLREQFKNFFGGVAYLSTYQIKQCFYQVQLEDAIAEGLLTKVEDESFPDNLWKFNYAPVELFNLYLEKAKNLGVEYCKTTWLSSTWKACLIGLLYVGKVGSYSTAFSNFENSGVSRVGNTTKMVDQWFADQMPEFPAGFIVWASGANFDGITNEEVKKKLLNWE